MTRRKIMAKFANQKHIHIHKENPWTLKNNSAYSGKAFLSIFNEVVEDASRDLKGEIPFKLFIYLASNKDNYDFDFSSTYFRDLYGCSIDATKRAFNQLVERGYLVPNEKGTKYEFFERPQQSIINLFDEKRIIKDGKGNSKVFTYKEWFEYANGKTTEERIKEIWDSAEVQEE